MAENKNFVVYITRQYHVNICRKLVNFTPRQLNHCFCFTKYDLSNGSYTQETHDLLTFLNNPPDLFKDSVKAIVFNAEGFKKEDNIVDYKIYQQVADKLIHHKIPFRFLPNVFLTATCQLIAANIDSDIDKTVYQLQVFPKTVSFMKLIHTPNGYYIAQYCGYKHITKNCFDSSGPFKVILSNAANIAESELSDYIAKTKEALKAYNPIILSNCQISKHVFEAVKGTVNHMFNGSISKHLIQPSCLNLFRVTNKKSNENMDGVLIKTDPNSLLPISKSCVVSRFHKTFYLTGKLNSVNAVFKHLQKPHQVTNDCHQIKLTLSIDINEYPTVTHEPIILPRVRNMPKKLNIEKTEKLPIIGFFDNISIICLWNEKENCYKFLDSWNGKFGKDLFLNFLLPKPKLVAPTPEVTSSSGTIYDLIKIMSMPPNTIKVNPDWKFTFTENDDYPVLLEFDTYEKVKKAASPSFLMAMMLKQHIKAIRKVTDEKPGKLGFRLLDDFENLEARKRVEAGLKGACGMIKLECFFV